MAQSFQVAPEYVDEITFTTKVSSIEYRVSNQIQVSINIVGIRYRTNTSPGVGGSDDARQAGSVSGGREGRGRVDDGNELGRDGTRHDMDGGR